MRHFLTLDMTIETNIRLLVLCFCDHFLFLCFIFGLLQVTCSFYLINCSLKSQRKKDLPCHTKFPHLFKYYSPFHFVVFSLFYRLHAYHFYVLSLFHFFWLLDTFFAFHHSIVNLRRRNRKWITFGDVHKWWQQLSHNFRTEIRNIAPNFHCSKFQAFFHPVGSKIRNFLHKPIQYSSVSHI